MDWLWQVWTALTAIFQPETLATTFFATAVGGAVVYLLTVFVQRRFDRERVRRDLIARVAATTASMQSRVQHYSRRAEHEVFRGRGKQRANELAELERQWVTDEVELRALNVEIDAYYGPRGPGTALHYVRDLLVIQYMQKTGVPERQREETVAAVLRPHDEMWLLKAPHSDKAWDAAYTYSVTEMIRGLRRLRITRPYGPTRVGDGLPRK